MVRAHTRLPGSRRSRAALQLRRDEGGVTPLVRRCAAPCARVTGADREQGAAIACVFFCCNSGLLCDGDTLFLLARGRVQCWTVCAHLVIGKSPSADRALSIPCGANGLALHLPTH